MIQISHTIFRLMYSDAKTLQFRAFPNLLLSFPTHTAPSLTFLSSCAGARAHRRTTHTHIHTHTHCWPGVLALLEVRFLAGCTCNLHQLSHQHTKAELC